MTVAKATVVDSWNNLKIISCAYVWLYILFKICQEKQRLPVTPQRKENTRSHFEDDDDKDDSLPPSGNCGSNGSNFSIPGNRFIF